jgi:hypothetical protein
VSGSGAGTNGATGTTPAPAANGIGGTAGAAIGGAVGGGSGSAVGGAAGGLINDLLGGKSKKKKDKSQNATQPAPTTEPGAGGTAAPAAPTNTQETLPLPTNNETTTEPGATGAEPGANGN